MTPSHGVHYFESPLGEYHRSVEQVQGKLHIKERFALEPRRDCRNGFLSPSANGLCVS